MTRQTACKPVIDLGQELPVTVENIVHCSAFLVTMFGDVVEILCCVKDSDDENGFLLYGVNDDVGNFKEYQFSCTVNTSRFSTGRMFGKLGRGTFYYFEYGLGCSRRVILGDVCFNAVKISFSSL